MEIILRPVDRSALAEYLGGETELNYPADREILADYLSDPEPHRIILPSGRGIRNGYTYVATWTSDGGGDGLRDCPRDTVRRGDYNVYISPCDLLDRLVSGERITVFPSSDRRTVGELIF